MAMAIGHDLKFNVARIEDELLQIHLIISKRFLRLMARTMESGFEAGLIMRSAHAAATAAGGRLDHHRVAEFFRDFYRLFLCLDDSIAAGRYRHADFACSRASSVLVAHRLHRTRGRADELYIAAFADFHEMRILCKEPIAGMDGVNIADLGRAHDSIDFQITFKAGRRTDADRFIGKLDVERINVCFRIDRKGANAEFLTSANHPQRDLPAISNQNFLEHGYFRASAPLALVARSGRRGACHTTQDFGNAHRTLKSAWPN